MLMPARRHHGPQGRANVLAWILVAASLLLPAIAHAQIDSTLRVLAVTAHADDNAAFAATIYKITHDLGGKVDLVVITDGAGGFKYSTLAESYYGLELTDPAVGRAYLPGIRKKEAMAGGSVVGIRNYFFLDQPDRDFTLNVDSIFRFVWDVPSVKTRLRQIMMNEKYDYILTLLPNSETHGGHKGATIMALEVASELPPSRRPVVLAETDSTKGKPASYHFTGLTGYPLTAVKMGGSRFHVDRSQKFGYHDALDYRIVVNWLIAEHKSQGTMQLLMNSGDVENFWFFDMNDPAAIPGAEALFERLGVVRFKKKSY
jgi:LmbE family N-acetylglucosaminyl deacetylase